MVPAGCRSPGRCCGNHSHQPDGISVGEHQKDGSGSVLPGPARPQKQLQHCTRRGRVRKREICRKILQSQVMRRRRCGQIRWKFSFVLSCERIFFIHSSYCYLLIAHQAHRKWIYMDMIKADQKDLHLILLQKTWAPCLYYTVTLIPSVVFSDVAMLCSYDEITLHLFVTIS